MSDTRSTVVLQDTSRNAGDVYFERLRGMTSSERLALGAALWGAADSLQRAAARRKDPEADESELTFRIAVSRFGPDLARRAYRQK